MYGQNNLYSQYPYNGYAYPNYGNRQFVQPQAQQPMQYETPIQDIRFVTSKEAEAFIVMPNSKALLIDKNGGMAHLKMADNMGESITHYFKFEQVNADGTPLKPQENTSHIDYSHFAHKEELEKFVTIDQYNTLLAKFEVIQKLIAGGKQNGNGTNIAKAN